MADQNLKTLFYVIQAEDSAGRAELALSVYTSRSTGCGHLQGLTDAAGAVGAVAESVRDAISQVAGASDFRDAARAADALAKVARLVAADAAGLAKGLRAAGRS